MEFYIGKGKRNQRPYEKIKRSKHWENIVNKHGYYVEILVDYLTDEEAKELEIFYIKKFGRIDTKSGNLINKTDGGSGGSTRKNYKNSELTREKISKALKNRVFSKKHIENLKNSLKNKKPISEETRKKLSESSKKRKPISEETREKLKGPKSEEHKLNLSIAGKGRIFSKEHIEKMKKPKSEEHRLNISKAAKNRKKTFWVCKDGEISKKIGIEEINTYLNNGWIRGRKIH